MRTVTYTTTVNHRRPPAHQTVRPRVHGSRPPRRVVQRLDRDRYPLTMRAIPERLRDASCGGAIQIDYLYLYLFLYNKCNLLRRRDVAVSGRSTCGRQETAAAGRTLVVATATLIASTRCPSAARQNTELDRGTSRSARRPWLPPTAAERTIENAK